MEKEYQLVYKEKKKLKKNGRKKTQYYKDTKVTRFIFIKVFTWFPIIITVMGTAIYSKEYGFSGGIISGGGLGLCFGFFMWIVAGIYYNISRQNSNIFCGDYGKEQLILKEDEVVYTINLEWNQTRINEAHIAFDQINKITVNNELNKLSIYGPFWILVTYSGENNTLLTNEYNKNGEEEISVDIPMYYNDIEEFIKILEERSGKKAVLVKEVKSGRDYVEEKI